MRALRIGFASALALAGCCASAHAATITPTIANAADVTAATNDPISIFGPGPYLATSYTPKDFFCPDCVGWIEDFESNSLDPFLSIDNGSILAPNATSGLMNSVTDSVDGDDGVVDGSGNGGHSWFTGTGAADDRQVTISFATPVKAAGLVFTDGDSVATTFKLEAFDVDGNSLRFINAGDLADDKFTGETAEDAFLGFNDSQARIASIRLSMDNGSGIEIDHVHWQEACASVPEPATFAMGLMALLGLVGLRQRRS